MSASPRAPIMITTAMITYFWLVLLVLLTYNSRTSAQTSSGVIGCSWSLYSANSSYPSLGVMASGYLTYNATAAPLSLYSTYPSGYALLSINGTRTVWSASVASSSTYTTSSTVAITGLVPSNNTAANFGTLVPPIGYLYDNYVYPQSSVADHLDASGWLMYVSAISPRNHSH